MEELKLIKISPEKYSDYRYSVIFSGYKWDPKVGDHNTILPYAVVIDRKQAKQLEEWAAALSRETVLLEEALLKRLAKAKRLGIPNKILRALKKCTYDRQKNIRIMRFDFHPTVDGWAVSEVNGDVPGGFAEASVMPQIAAEYLHGYVQQGNLADELTKAFAQKIKKGGTVACVHATAYSDDRQVMDFIGDRFIGDGINALPAAPDHIFCQGGQAYCMAQDEKTKIDGILRFFPLEWFVNLPRRSDLSAFFSGKNPCCNHPISILSQSKRLPLVWDDLDVDVIAWKSLLPPTVDPKQLHRKNKNAEKSIESNQNSQDNSTESNQNSQDKNWIFKPAMGRVGEGISIKGAVDDKELKKIAKAARRDSRNWVAQKMFVSKPLDIDGKQFHLCIGVFTVDGAPAGFYGRISPYARIDHRATDVPILVAKE